MVVWLFKKNDQINFGQNFKYWIALDFMDIFKKRTFSLLL
jgi:hypothetical protein